MGDCYHRLRVAEARRDLVVGQRHETVVLNGREVLGDGVGFEEFFLLGRGGHSVVADDDALGVCYESVVIEDGYGLESCYLLLGGRDLGLHAGNDRLGSGFDVEDLAQVGPGDLGGGHGETGTGEECGSAARSVYVSSMDTDCAAWTWAQDSVRTSVLMP